MSRDILGKLSPDLIRDLARRRGHEPVAGEKTEETARWLLEHYASGVGEAARGGKDLLMERARKSIGRLRAAVGLTEGTVTPEPGRDGSREGRRAGGGGALDAADTMPRSRALRTRTLAEVYEKQGMTAEALEIYREVASRDPSDAASARAIERLDRQPVREVASDGDPAPEPRPDEPNEGRAEPGPSVGRDAWSPSLDSPVRDHAGPVELPDLEEPPGRYGTDEAFLMMVSPTILYACWEISPETEHRTVARVGGGPARTVLRIIRMAVSVTGDVSEDVVAEVDAPGTAGDYFFHGAVPDTIYRMEIGFVTAGGQVTALFGNPAATSADVPAERFDEEWMVVDQASLSVRRPEVVPLEVKQRSRLSPRQMALLRLNLLGPEAYGALTGLDPDRLRSLVIGLTRAPVAGSSQGSSDIHVSR